MVGRNPLALWHLLVSLASGDAQEDFALLGIQTQWLIHRDRPDVFGLLSGTLSHKAQDLSGLQIVRELDSGTL